MRHPRNEVLSSSRVQNTSVPKPIPYTSWFNLKVTPPSFLVGNSFPSPSALCPLTSNLVFNLIFLSVSLKSRTVLAFVPPHKSLPREWC